MKQRMKRIVRGLAPPVLLDAYRFLFQSSSYVGNYRSWDEARRNSGGYDSDIILNKVKDALLKVKNGEAACERDSVLFDKVHYSWPLLSGLLWVASRSNNTLNLIDFGGSLGSSYFQNRMFLSHLHEFTWNVVEQGRFVECGRRYFEDDHLKFYYRIDECLKERQVNAILLSSVLQYLEKPYDLLKEILDSKFRYLLFDRTPFVHTGDDRIAIQKVPAEIYEASYPSWLFDQRKFLDVIGKSYELVADFESNDRTDIPVDFKGYIFKLRNDA